MNGKNDGSIFMDATQKLLTINLISDFKKTIDQRNKEVSGLEKSVFQNKYFEQINFSNEIVFKMISHTVLDNEGSDVLLEELLMFMKITSMKNQKREVIDFYRDRVQQAFFLAYQKDQKLSQQSLLSMANVILSNTVKLDTPAIPTNEWEKLQATMKQLSEKVQNDT